MHVGHKALPGYVSLVTKMIRASWGQGNKEGPGLELEFGKIWSWKVRSWSWKVILIHTI